MINPIQLMQAMRNPQAFMNQIIGNQQMMNNPMIKNTVNMAQKGDMKGIEKMARNLCKEKGLNADEIFNQFKSKINM